jgi:predicted tellurium resistance membrane protein TerC
VQFAAIKALGQCCLMEKQLALENLSVFMAVYQQLQDHVQQLEILKVL